MVGGEGLLGRGGVPHRHAATCDDGCIDASHTQRGGLLAWWVRSIQSVPATLKPHSQRRVLPGNSPKHKQLQPVLESVPVPGASLVLRVPAQRLCHSDNGFKAIQHCVSVVIPRLNHSPSQSLRTGPRNAASPPGTRGPHHPAAWSRIIDQLHALWAFGPIPAHASLLWYVLMAGGGHACFMFPASGQRAGSSA